MDLLIAIIILFWAGTSKGPGYIWKKGAGWFFELHVLVRYICIITSGCYISYKIYPPGLGEALVAKWPPLWVIAIVLVALPALFIFARRKNL